ncbi:MAG: UDP-N-acetylenolpyruvoylglucosamine reductase [Chloroflexi bacterium RBG_16_64_43]|nr:MAG: UDP-N-acetylenolpyruvoylglucosamine reductase [Chloroflexi bacterium RBG_16_64_43]
MLALFGEKLQSGVGLARYTSARIGGPADGLLIARSAEDLADVVSRLWMAEVPFIMLGAGSNVLISDRGCREVVILNHAKRVEFQPLAEDRTRCKLWTESGASFGGIARAAAQKGWSGIEWASTVPGTVGGAVVGNAGAFGGDMNTSLHMASILQRGNQQVGSNSTAQVARVTAKDLGYSYRSSRLKRERGSGVVLSAEFLLASCSPAEAMARVEALSGKRRETQPPGASMGSMFKNPTGDYAGRLIEAAGLKGRRIGEAEISTVHANFFVNTGQAKAADVKALMDLARSTVHEQFGVTLEPEVELIGEWGETAVGAQHA